MANAETINKWYQDWGKKADARFAMKEFLAIAGSDDWSTLRTQERIITACFNAAHYKPERDPGALYRKEMQVEKTRVKKLAKAAGLLARSAGLNHKSLMWADIEASIKSNARITRIENNEPKSLHLVMYDYFSQLETALKGKLPEVDGGPFLGKFTIGNLFFDKPIGAGPPIAVETMLAYELAFYMRMHTAGRAGDGIQDAQPMPDDKEGDPCFRVVAAFCSAVFPNGGKQTGDEKLTGDAVRNLIKRGTGLAVQWTGVDTG